MEIVGLGVFVDEKEVGKVIAPFGQDKFKIELTEDYIQDKTYSVKIDGGKPY